MTIFITKIKHPPVSWNIQWILYPCIVKCLGIPFRFINPMLKYLEKLWNSLDTIENVYSRKMSVIQNIINQLLVFSMCDILLTNEGTVKHYGLTGLNSLLFYYVVTFFVKRIIDIVKNIGNRNVQQLQMKSLVISILKIVLEWCKAVVLILCLKEQGLRPHPSVLYTGATLSYYVCTESVFVQLLPEILGLFEMASLEGLETLYAPVLLQIFSITLSSVLSLAVIFQQRCIFAILCMYHTVLLKFKYFYISSWNELEGERRILDKFRPASQEEILRRDDICAVCLGAMRSARVTPCNHVFHADCLRQCYRNSNRCPLCKSCLDPDPDTDTRC